jgi:dihydroxy-acid dehydratase
MKTSVISDEYRNRYLSNPVDPNAFEGRAFVFDGPEDYHARIDDSSLDITADDILVMRGAGPIGFPGAAEVVNMQPPARLIREGVRAMPCIGDGRQSGTSGSPSILNASPEAAAGGNLALLRTGDRLRIDLGRGRVDLLLSDEEIAARRAVLEAGPKYAYPPSQTPWQALQRASVGQLSDGAILEGTEIFQRISTKFGVPRDNH